MALQTKVIQGGSTSMTQPFHNAGEKGYNYYHGGVDLTGFNGGYNTLAWITAHSAGTVVDLRKNCTGFEDGSYGNYVLLKHDNGYFTMYAHLAYGLVKVNYNQKVTAGQILGYMDNTGHSFGGHLHFEIRKPDGTPIDPEPYLGKDLPGLGKKSKYVFTYQVWDDVTKKWQNNVTSNSGYAGKAGFDIDAVYVNCNKGNVKYAVHTWKGDRNEKYPDSKWLPESTNRTTHAGKANRPIDGFILKSDVSAKYRVHLRKSNKWLPWVYTKNSNYKDASKGYAGNLKEPIDAIQIKPV